MLVLEPALHGKTAFVSILALTMNLKHTHSICQLTGVTFGMSL